MVVLHRVLAHSGYVRLYIIFYIFVFVFCILYKHKNNMRGWRCTTSCNGTSRMCRAAASHHWVPHPPFSIFFLTITIIIIVLFLFFISSDRSSYIDSVLVEIRGNQLFKYIYIVFLFEDWMQIDWPWWQWWPRWPWIYWAQNLSPKN